MSDSSSPRPILIPPLSKTDAALEVVRERPSARREVEHPHCDEHFLFTPYCAACLEAERTQAATAKATPLPSSTQHRNQQTHSPQPRSRSFGFTDAFPTALTVEPTLAERLATYGGPLDDYGIVGDAVDTLLKL